MIFLACGFAFALVLPPLALPARPLARPMSATCRAPLPLAALAEEVPAEHGPESSAPLLPALLRCAVEASACLAGYLVHVLVLSRRALPLLGRRVGLDTIVGLGVLAMVAQRGTARTGHPLPAWVRSDSREEEARSMLDLRALPQREKLALLGTATLLLVAPIAFAFLSPLLEALLYVFAALGLPMGEASLLGARVLLEQTVVYVVLLKLLASRHAPFFRDGAWVRWRWRGAWAAPVLGGYAASVALFNLVEPLNQALWPHLEYMQEGMVAKLANPPGKSLSALLVGSLTPCVGAPLYEEVQSRAFILQALTAVVPLRAAVVLSGVLFGIQHLQLGLALPLSVTGAFWGALYVQSGNLLVPVLVHALWNARIFLGSYLGL
jgi:membrane protease YdiL (CAAX protease family)